MRRRALGFTVLEVIVSLGLLSMVALAIVGVFSKLMTASSKTADSAVAELLARAVLDKSTRAGPPDWGVAEGSSRLDTADSSSATEFLYRVEAQPLPGSEHTLGRLYRVKVLVSWGDSLSKESRRDQGNLWLERQRLTYVEGDGP